MGLFFRKKKRSGHEAVRSPPPTAEVMMTGPIPHFAIYAFMQSTDIILLLLRWALINIADNKADGNKSTGETNIPALG